MPTFGRACDLELERRFQIDDLVVEQAFGELRGVLRRVHVALSIYFVYGQVALVRSTSRPWWNVLRRGLECFCLFLLAFDFALEFFKSSTEVAMEYLFARSALGEPGNEGEREPHQPDCDRRLDQSLSRLLQPLPVDPIAERDDSEVEYT